MKRLVKQVLSASLCILLLLLLMPLWALAQPAAVYVEDIPQELYIVFSDSQYDLWDDCVYKTECMTEVSERVFEIETHYTEGTTLYFRFSDGGERYDGMVLDGTEILIGRTFPLLQNTGLNIPLTLSKSGNVVITVDLNGLYRGEAATICVRWAPRGLCFAPVGCKAPKSWEQCYIYCWDDDGDPVGTEWPGMPMSKDEYLIWRGSFPGFASNYLFHDGSGGIEDGSVVPKDGAVYWHEQGRWCSDREAIYGTGWGVRGLFLAGICLTDTFSYWSFNDEQGRMIRESECVFTRTFDVPADTSMLFTVVEDSPYADRLVFDDLELKLGRGVPAKLKRSGDNIELFVKKDCRLKLTVDLREIYGGDKSTLRVEKAAAEIVESDNLYRVVGSADWLGEWNPAFDAGLMQKISPGRYRKIFYNAPPGTYEFQITQDGTWDHVRHPGMFFTVESEGTVVIDLTLNDGGAVIAVSGPTVTNVTGAENPATADGSVGLTVVLLLLSMAALALLLGTRQSLYKRTK